MKVSLPRTWNGAAGEERNVAIERGGAVADLLVRSDIGAADRRRYTVPMLAVEQVAEF
jgi:hypothetical protein